MTLAGTYKRTIIGGAANGCDSMVVLNLQNAVTVRNSIDVTIRQGEVYEFDGRSLTVQGTYTGNFKSQVTGCDSVVTLNLYPNPVKRGESVQIDYEFNSAEQQGLILEVFNIVGQRVYIERPSVYPLAIRQFPMAGVYLVRITTGDDQLFYGRIVVE